MRRGVSVSRVDNISAGARAWDLAFDWRGQRRELRLPEPGVICFTPGTLIDTPAGPRPVEALRPGDRVLTRDDGAQELLWVGSRRMSGARLYALPHLRPVRLGAVRLGAVRLRAGAFGLLRPAADLLVSPQHRLLVRGAAARALFNEPEVLVQAVITRIKELGAVAVRKLDGIEETVKFPLPKGLKLDAATGLEITERPPETGTGGH